MTPELREAILAAESSVAAARDQRLGLLVSVAFHRFVRLFRKYNPDQPRDERGRWVETGEEGDAGEGDLPTGTVVQRHRSGNPDVDRVTQKLEQMLDEVAERLGPGSGPAFGTLVHRGFARAVREADIPGIGRRGVESSFSAGDFVRYGSDGSYRTDVIMRADPDGNGGVIAIWDVKTGSATLSDSRAQELRRAVNVDSYVPLIVLSKRGTYNKSHFRISESRRTCELSITP